MMAGSPKPNKRRALGMRGALCLMIALTITCTVLGVSTIYAYHLHRTSYVADRLRVRTIAETYAAQVVRLMAGPPQDFAAGIESIPWHPDMCLLAILNNNHEVVVCRGNCDMLQQYMTRPEWRQGDITVTFGSEEPTPIPNLHLAAAKIPAVSSKESAGTLVCAIKASQYTLWTKQDLYYLFIKVAVLIGVGTIFGFYWLHKTILTPLMELARVTNDGRTSSAAITLSTGRYDEIGQLAQVLCDLQKESEKWQQRATHLERSLHDRVAVETKKVERELQQTKKEIWIDPLTQLGNRRLLELRFGEIFETQCQAGEDLSIVMLDIDNFKNLNDTLGHKAGDRLLEFVGDLLRQFLRDRDIAIRYGGDEFTIVLSGVTVSNAMAIAERTIALFSQQAKLLPVDPKPTMSAGIASLCEHQPKTPESLLHLADTALYHAKKAGKCCAKIYSPNQIAPKGEPKQLAVKS